MRAVIVAGGQGVRLRPYTTVLPKPLMPVGGIPIIEIIIRQLRNFGFGHIAICLGYGRDLIETYLGDGRKWNVHIEYIVEDQPLGTVGPLAFLSPGPDNESVLVTNADVLTDLNFRKFMAFHIMQSADFTAAVCEREVVIPSGVLSVTDGRITQWQEKPVIPYQASMGIYAIRVEAVRTFVKGMMDIPDFVKLILGHGRTMAFACRSQWIDVGREEDLKVADRLFTESPNVYLHETNVKKIERVRGHSSCGI